LREHRPKTAVSASASNCAAEVVRQQAHRPLLSPALSNFGVEAGLVPNHLQVEVESAPTTQETQNRGHEHVRISWFRHMHRVATGSIKIAVSAMEHVRDVSLFEPFAKLRALTIAERVIQDDGRRNLVFYGNERTGK
jgi:hypothetical protein